MTQEALTEQLGRLADAVLSDPRWQQDDISVEVLGMLLYGFALMMGRTVMYLDLEDIDAAVTGCLVEYVGAAPKWSGGLVAEANASAFDKPHHPAHHELIGVGHSSFGVKDPREVIDNVFTNIDRFRRASRPDPAPPRTAPGGWLSRGFRALFHR